MCLFRRKSPAHNEKKCAPGRTLAPSAVAVRQHSTFRASAHPQRSVFFYTIGNEISYRTKKSRQMAAQCAFSIQFSTGPESDEKNFPASFPNTTARTGRA